VRAPYSDLEKAYFKGVERAVAGNRKRAAEQAAKDASLAAANAVAAAREIALLVRARAALPTASGQRRGGSAGEAGGDGGGGASGGGGLGGGGLGVDVDTGAGAERRAEKEAAKDMLRSVLNAAAKEGAEGKGGSGEDARHAHHNAHARGHHGDKASALLGGVPLAEVGAPSEDHEAHAAKHSAFASARESLFDWAVTPGGAGPDFGARTYAKDHANKDKETAAEVLT
jgi:hypothetical protein